MQYVHLTHTKPERYSGRSGLKSACNHLALEIDKLMLMRPVLHIKRAFYRDFQTEIAILYFK